MKKLPNKILDIFNHWKHSVLIILCFHWDLWWIFNCMDLFASGALLIPANSLVVEVSKKQAKYFVLLIKSSWAQTFLLWTATQNRCKTISVYSKGRKQQPFIIPNPPICTVVPSKAVIIEPGPDGSATSGPFLSWN